MATQHEKLHFTLQKVIGKLKKPKKRSTQPAPTTNSQTAVYTPYQTQQAYPQYPAPTGVIPGYPQYQAYPGAPLEQTYQIYTTQQYQIQTLEQQYQMQTQYRIQLEEQENLLAAQSSPFTAT
jgi:hypothetical protein